MVGNIHTNDVLIDQTISNKM